MGQIEDGSYPLPEAVIEALQDPDPRRRYRHLKDPKKNRGSIPPLPTTVERLVEEFTASSEVFSQLDPAADLSFRNEDGVQVCSLEGNLDGKKITTRVTRGEENGRRLKTKYLILTQRYEGGSTGEFPMMRICDTTTENNIRKIDIFFGTASKPNIFHAGFDKSGRLQCCSFVAFPPVNPEKETEQAQKVSEFVYVQPDWVHNRIKAGIYYSPVLNARKVSTEELDEVIGLNSINKLGELVKFISHSVHLSNDASRLVINHMNEDTSEQSSPYLSAKIPWFMDPKRIASLYSLDGPQFVEACASLPLFFSLPAAWIEFNLEKTLPR